ncbi:MAG: hypothetical protein ACOY99_08950 [Pseudomonadota bacterium]
MAKHPSVKKRRYWLAGDRHPGQDAFFVAALDTKLWRPGDARHWDSCWCTGMPEADVFARLSATKTINHIPGNNGLTVKSYLHQTLAAARARLAGGPHAGRMDFFPRVYAMPGDYHALQRAAARNREKRWILKPKNSSRGRGVRVLGDVASVPLGAEWMVQEYLDRPHLMNGHKYVLRLYLLITSVEPLRVYLYHEGFAKLASAPFDLDDVDNLFSHLTNPDINAENKDAEAPVVFIGLARYRAWLRGQGHDDAALFARIHDLARLLAIAARETMRTRLAAIKADTHGCYELLGVDCLIDADLKPWVLECNLSPSLEVCAAPEDGGDFEKATKRQLVADMVALLGLNEAPAPRQASTPMARQRAAFLREEKNAGGFLRLIPSADAFADLSLFPVPRHADVAQAEWAMARPAPPFPLAVAATHELIDADGLSLYNEIGGRLYTPQDVAAWVWLKVAQGGDPDGIVRDMLAQGEGAVNAADAETQQRARALVWNMVADWGEAGLLRPANWPSVAALPGAVDEGGWQGEDGLVIGAARRRIVHGCPAAAARLRAAFAPALTALDEHHAQAAIGIMPAPLGYAIAQDACVVAQGLGLGELAPALWRMLIERAPGRDDVAAVRAALVPVGPGRAVVVASHREGGWDGLALALARRLGQGHAGAALLRRDGKAQGLPLPCRIAEEDAAAPSPEALIKFSHHEHLWPDGAAGRLIPAAQNMANKSFEIAAVIVPTRQMNDGRMATPQTLPPRAALPFLLPLCHRQGGNPLTGAAVGWLADWLARRRVCLIAAANLCRAADALSRLLSDLSGTKLVEELLDAGAQ